MLTNLLKKGLGITHIHVTSLLFKQGSGIRTSNRVSGSTCTLEQLEKRYSKILFSCLVFALYHIVVHANYILKAITNKHLTLSF